MPDQSNIIIGSTVSYDPWESPQVCFFPVPEVMRVAKRFEIGVRQGRAVTVSDDRCQAESFTR